MKNLTTAEKEAIAELRCTAEALGKEIDSVYSQADALRAKGETNKAGQGLRSMPAKVHARRFALAQILCLSGLAQQRGKWSDEQVFASKGSYGDAEWTARATAAVAKIEIA